MEKITQVINNQEPNGIPHLPNDGARLLSLDGGGVKGVSSLIILGETMERIKYIEITRGSKDKSDRRPADYFDLAAGTSTGGLMAVMLFRLKMTVPECRQEYFKLAKSIFAPRVLGFPITTPGIFQTLAKGCDYVESLLRGAIYKSGPLEKAIDTCVLDHPLDDNDRNELGQAPLIHKSAGKMFVCATLAAKGEAVLFRSYPQSEDSRPITPDAREAADHGAMDHVSISLATRATSAAPFFLPQVPWNPTGVPGKDLIFWDGGMLNNNPVQQLWNARYDLVGPKAPAPKTSCIVSLGCSYDTLLDFRWTSSIVIKLITSFMYVVNTKAKDRDFERYIQRIQGRGDENDGLRYFRFDANTGKRVFAMDDAASMLELEQVTRDWIANSPEVRYQLHECALKLVGQQS